MKILSTTTKKSHSYIPIRMGNLFENFKFCALVFYSEEEWGAPLRNSEISGWKYYIVVNIEIEVWKDTPGSKLCKAPYCAFQHFVHNWCKF